MPMATAQRRTQNQRAVVSKKIDGVTKGFPEVKDCPLCTDPLDTTDRNFFPCPCGYQVCLFCYGKLKEMYEGKCPGCRAKYTDEPVDADQIEAKMEILSEVETQSSQQNTRQNGDFQLRQQPQAAFSPHKQAPPRAQYYTSTLQTPIQNGISAQYQQRDIGQSTASRISQEQHQTQEQSQPMAGYANGATSLQSSVYASKYNMNGASNSKQQQLQPPRNGVSVVHQRQAYQAFQQSSMDSSSSTSIARVPVPPPVEFKENSSYRAAESNNDKVSTNLMNLLRKSSEPNAQSGSESTRTHILSQVTGERPAVKQLEVQRQAAVNTPPAIPVKDLVRVGYNSVEAELRSEQVGLGAVVDSVWPRLNQSRVQDNLQSSNFWSQFSAFNAGQGKGDLQSQAVWGTQNITDKLYVLPPPPRVRGQTPLYQRPRPAEGTTRMATGMLGKKTGAPTGAPPGFPASSGLSQGAHGFDGQFVNGSYPKQNAGLYIHHLLQK